MLRHVRRTDYYFVLEVKPGADAVEIRSAYRRLSRKHHPDNNTPYADTRKQQQLNAAWEILGDLQKRIQYDQQFTKRRRYASGVERARPAQRPHRREPSQEAARRKAAAARAKKEKKERAARRERVNRARQQARERTKKWMEATRRARERVRRQSEGEQLRQQQMRQQWTRRQQQAARSEQEDSRARQEPVQHGKRPQGTWQRQSAAEQENLRLQRRRNQLILSYDSCRK